MPKTIFIRHSQTKQNPDISSHQWQLTDVGRERCLLLAKHLEHHAVNRIISSEEEKALRTAQLTADAMSIPYATAPDLHETKRDTAPYYEKIDDFFAAIREGMSRPDELVFGEEKFADARARFAKQVGALLQQHPDETLAIVTHGTVMALYLAHLTGTDVFALWQSFDMPTYAVVDVADKTLETLVTDVSAKPT